MAESGIPAYGMAAWTGILVAVGSRVMWSSVSPEHVASFIRAESVKGAKAVKDSGAKIV